jgi:hypothetical protein
MLLSSYSTLLELRSLVDFFLLRCTQPTVNRSDHLQIISYNSSIDHADQFLAKLVSGHLVKLKKAKHFEAVIDQRSTIMLIPILFFEFCLAAPFSYPSNPPPTLLIPIRKKCRTRSPKCRSKRVECRTFVNAYGSTESTARKKEKCSGALTQPVEKKALSSLEIVRSVKAAPRVKQAGQITRNEFIDTSPFEKKEVVNLGKDRSIEPKQDSIEVDRIEGPELLAAHSEALQSRRLGISNDEQFDNHFRGILILLHASRLSFPRDKRNCNACLRNWL